MKQWHPNIVAEWASESTRSLSVISAWLGTQQKQTRFYGHKGEIGTLGFHKLKGEYYRGSIGGRENFENAENYKGRT